MSDPTPYERLGGEPALRAVIDEFVDRAFADLMIGFFFRNADKQRVKDKEFELASSLLGGPHTYTGKPLRDAHGPHRIMGGQFMRRRKILQEVLEAHAVAPDIVALWLEHTDRLRDQVTYQQPGQCD